MERCIPRYSVPYEPHASCCTNKNTTNVGQLLGIHRKVKADKKEVKSRELKDQGRDKHTHGKDVPL
jgi:hypothetical protein